MAKAVEDKGGALPGKAVKETRFGHWGTSKRAAGQTAMKALAEHGRLNAPVAGG